MKMKKIFLFIPALLLGMLSFSQSWEWVNKGANSNTDISADICVDGNGNLIAIGESNSDISFGSNNLVSSSTEFGFMVKYSATGETLWAKKIYDSEYKTTNLLSVVSDNDGSFVIVGEFENTINVAGSEITSSGNQDIFILKFDESGNLDWIKTGGGDNDDAVYDVVSDGENFYVIADFIDNASYGSFDVEAESVNLSMEISVIKYSAEGDEVWVTTAGGISYDNPTSIAYDGTNLYITGYFSSVDADFGSTVLHCDGVTNIFLAKLNPSSGSFIWAKDFVTDLSVVSYLDKEWMHVVADESSVYMAGYYNNDLTLDETTTLNNEGDIAFISSFTNSGVLNWVKEVEAGDGTPYITSVSLNEGNLFFVGDYTNSVNIDEFEMIGTQAGGYFPYLTNAYIFSLNTDGTVNWGKSVDAYYGASYDAGNVSINSVVSFENSVYTGGTFSKEIHLDGFVIDASSSVDVFYGEIDKNCNAVDQLDIQSNIHIYPNPTSDYIMFNYNKKNNYSYKLVNVNGDIIASESDICGECIIDMQSNPSGVYFIYVNSDNGTDVCKIIKL